MTYLKIANDERTYINLDKVDYFGISGAGVEWWVYAYPIPGGSYALNSTAYTTAAAARDALAALMDKLGWISYG